ncbi:MAG: T9SS type A sorting domain-containing protein [Saprospiraceae bacterium]|nr:T9SS type A sorting domain-containing protein [Saprospiraceae bacterium]
MKSWQTRSFLLPLLTVCFCIYGASLQAQNFILENFSPYAKALKNMKTDSAFVVTEFADQKFYYSYDKGLLVQRRETLIDKNLPDKPSVNTVTYYEYTQDFDKHTTYILAEGALPKLSKEVTFYYKDKKTLEVDSIVSQNFEQGVLTSIDKNVFTNDNQGLIEELTVRINISDGSSTIYSKNEKYLDSEGRINREIFFSYDFTDLKLKPYREILYEFGDGSWLISKISVDLAGGAYNRQDSIRYQNSKKGILETADHFEFYNGKWNFVLQEVFDSNEPSPVPEKVLVYKHNGKLEAEEEYKKQKSNNGHTTEPLKITHEKFDPFTGQLETDYEVNTNYLELDNKHSFGTYTKILYPDQKAVINVNAWFSDINSSTIPETETRALSDACFIPNPLQTYSKFNLPGSATSERRSLIITSTNGQRVFQKEFFGGEAEIDMPLQKGLYFANIIAASKLVCVQKVVIF